MKHIIMMLALFTLAFIVACEKKLESIPVGEMSEYKDPAYGFRFQYPKEWKQLGTAGKAVFAKSQDILDKFLDPRSGIDGAVVTVEVLPYSKRTAAEEMQAVKDELKAMNAEVTPDEQTTMAGKPATKMTYRIQATTKTSIFGYMIFVQGDTALYTMDFKGYGDQFKIHTALFDAMEKTLQLPVIVAKGSDKWQPSVDLETYNSNYFSMQYPDNLNMYPMSKGDKDLVMEMRADRQDCSIHADVFGAKGLTTEKVWEQNKGKYRAQRTGESTIDGIKAYWVDYSLRSDIGSRAYFVVKNDKVIRVTINWYSPQRDVYFPVFEKCVASVKLK